MAADGSAGIARAEEVIVAAGAERLVALTDAFGETAGVATVAVGVIAVVALLAGIEDAIAATSGLAIGAAGTGQIIVVAPAIVALLAGRLVDEAVAALHRCTVGVAIAGKAAGVAGFAVITLAIAARDGLAEGGIETTIVIAEDKAALRRTEDRLTIGGNEALLAGRKVVAVAFFVFIHCPVATDGPTAGAIVDGAIGRTGDRADVAGAQPRDMGTHVQGQTFAVERIEVAVAPFFHFKEAVAARADGVALEGDGGAGVEAGIERGAVGADERELGTDVSDGVFDRLALAGFAAVDGFAPADGVATVAADLVGVVALLTALTLAVAAARQPTIGAAGAEDAVDVLPGVVALFAGLRIDVAIAAGHDAAITIAGGRIAPFVAAFAQIENLVAADGQLAGGDIKRAVGRARQLAQAPLID